jgi:hypothetical protein
MTAEVGSGATLQVRDRTAFRRGLASPPAEANRTAHTRGAMSEDFEREWARQAAAAMARQLDAEIMGGAMSEKPTVTLHGFGRYDPAYSRTFKVGESFGLDMWSITVESIDCGFTWEDVDLLRGLSTWTPHEWPGADAKLRDLADRIAALLPPRED